MTVDFETLDFPVQPLDELQAEIELRVYVSYLTSLVGEIERNYASFEKLLQATYACSGVSRITKNTQLNDQQIDDIRRALFNAWNTELVVALQSEYTDDLKQVTNHWLAIQSYYAVYLAVRALFQASSDGCANTHPAALKKLANWIRTRPLFPYPWSIWCEGCDYYETLNYGGISGNKNPVDVHPLSHVVPGPDRICKFLKTTRKRQLEKAKNAFKERHRRKTLPSSITKCNTQRV